MSDLFTVIARSNFFSCHCEERSDEAISTLPQARAPRACPGVNAEGSCEAATQFLKGAPGLPGGQPQKIMNKQGHVYLLTNKINTVIYTGVTSDLKKRVWEHKNHLVKGFTEKYKVNKLIYFETCAGIIGAIEREKQNDRTL